MKSILRGWLTLLGLFLVLFSLGILASQWLSAWLPAPVEEESNLQETYSDSPEEYLSDENESN